MRLPNPLGEREGVPSLACRYASLRAVLLPDERTGRRRALFAGDYARLQSLTRRWPIDVQRHLARLLDLPA